MSNNQMPLNKTQPHELTMWRPVYIIKCCITYTQGITKQG